MAMTKTDYALVFVQSLCEFGMAVAVYCTWKEYGDGVAFAGLALLIMLYRSKK